MGVVLGVLVARALTNELSSSEFEALGTWAGAFVTIAALILAYVVHRSEAAARADDQYAQEVREYNRRKAEEDARNAIRQLEQDDAALVSVTVTVLAHQITADPDVRLLESVKVTLVNRSTAPATDVVLEVERLSLKRNWIQLEPATRDPEVIPVKLIEIPREGTRARDQIHGQTELRFTMHKRRWTWTPNGGLRERL